MDLKDQDLIMVMKLLNPHNWEEYPNAPELAERGPARTIWEEMQCAPNNH